MHPPESARANPVRSETSAAQVQVAALSLERLEKEVQLCAISAPLLDQVILAHRLRDFQGRASILVALPVDLEVGARNEGLVETHRLAGLTDNVGELGVTLHLQPRPRAHRGVGHEDLTGLD